MHSARTLLATTLLSTLALPAAAQVALDRDYLFYGYGRADVETSGDNYHGLTVQTRTEVNTGAKLNLELTYAVRNANVFTGTGEADFTNGSALYQQVFEAAPTYSVSGLIGASYGTYHPDPGQESELGLALGALGELQTSERGAAHGRVMYHGAEEFGLGISIGFTQYFENDSGIRLEYSMYETATQVGLMFGYGY